MRLDGTANVVGALCQVITDETADAMGTAGTSVSSAAALSAMHHFLDGPSVDRLRQVLGLTSSGTVRLLDRLERADLIERGPGPNGRTASVELTAAGQIAAEAVGAARASVLERALGVLSPADRATFGNLAGQVLVGMMRGPGAVRWMCRLCDIGVCRGAADDGCPVTNAARARYGGPQPASDG